MSEAILVVGVAALLAATYATLKPTRTEKIVTRTMQIRMAFSVLIAVFFVIYALQTGVWWLILAAAVAVALGVAWLMVERPWGSRL